MNDHDVLHMVHDGLSGLDMDTPAETIVMRGDARQRRRRLAGVAVGGALAATLGVGVPALMSSAASAPSVPASPTQLAAFTLVSDHNGDATLTLAKDRVLDPEALRQALAADGVPSVVRVGSFCHSPAAPPPGLDAVLSSQRRADGSVVLIIRPSAMPKGAQLSIGYRPLSDRASKDRVRFVLTWADQPLTCEQFG
jgi:hypothetical protein